MNLPPPERSPLSGLWSQRVEFVLAQRPSHALTLAYNETAPLSRVRSDLRRLQARLDRALVGRRFNRRPGSSRTWFAAFIEHLDTNTHAHLALRAPPRRAEELAQLFDVSPSPWMRIAPCGTHDLRPPHDPRGWVSYATKEMTARSEWFLSDEFLPDGVAAR
jgi:hypothetical protein